MEPLDGLGTDRPERVELLCAAMHLLVHGTSVTDGTTLLEEAEALARTVPGPRAEAVAAIGRAVLAASSARVADDALDKALTAADRCEQTGDQRLVVSAMHAEMQARLHLGDIDGMGSRLPRFRAAGQASLLPFARTRARLLEVAIALARGDLGAAEEHLAGAERLAVELAVVSARHAAFAQRQVLRIEQGRCDEVLDAYVAAGSPGGPWAVLPVLATTHLGRLAEARAMLEERLAALGEFADHPGRSSALVLLAEAAHACTHRAAAAAAGAAAGRGRGTIRRRRHGDGHRRADRPRPRTVRARWPGTSTAPSRPTREPGRWPRRAEPGCGPPGARSTSPRSSGSATGQGDRAWAARLVEDVAGSGLARASAWLARQLAATR